MKKGLVLIATLIFAGVVLAYLNRAVDMPLSRDFEQGKSDSTAGSVFDLPNEIFPEPFSDLTIPYLRERNYSSSLNEMSQVSTNGFYTSYLTSYNSDGLNINALITMPNGEEPENGWPAVVFVHGYIPPSQYTTQGNYVSYVDYLARNGFVVLKVDLRGHGSSEGNPSGAYYSSDYVIDTLNAYSALQNTEFIDSGKIGLWGHSMGGNVVFRSLVVKKDIPAVVIWAGAVYTYEDFREYGISDNSYRPPSTQTPSQQQRRMLFEAHGDFKPDNDFWKKVVPTNFLDGVKTSLQINHAVNDDVVSIEYSRNLKKVLEGTGINFDLNEYNTGGHNINGSAFNSAMQSTVEFYKSNL
jgi:dipeptidyl aminopeptidase/acylaminoacyl peptidase